LGKSTVIISSVLVTCFLLSGICYAKEESMGLELEWTFNISDQFPGITFGAGHQGCITTWDLNTDGAAELLFGTRRGHSKRLWCIEGDGTFKWIYPPMDEDGLTDDPISKVSLVDVDKDGIHELAFSDRSGRLHVLNPEGSAMWTWDEPERAGLYGPPQAYDVDGDGFVEFFMLTWTSIHRVNHEGELVWTAQASGGSSHPTIADVDRDGSFEVLWASGDYYTYCVSAHTGEEEWRFDTGSNQPRNPVMVTDIDGDTEYEVITWSDAPSSAVFVISYFGTELARWTYPVEGGNIRNCHPMGDLDGDGSTELVIMGGSAAFAVKMELPEPTTMWMINFSRWSEDGIIPSGAQPNHWSSYQLIADIDGDDEQEVLWLAPFPVVTDGATGELEGYYVNELIARNRRQESGGWWGDVDGDGTSEWVCELNGNSHPETMLYCLTMGGKFPAEAYWPEFCHSAYPAEYQYSSDWLPLKAAHSNSLWFPIKEVSLIFCNATALLLTLSAIGLRRKKKARATPRKINPGQHGYTL